MKHDACITREITIQINLVTTVLLTTSVHQDPMPQVRPIPSSPLSSPNPPQAHPQPNPSLHYSRRVSEDYDHLKRM